MKEFIGTKRVLGAPMTLGGYNIFRGWKIPDDENPTREGYYVEEIDIKQSNSIGTKIHATWSPKEVFEATYRSCQNMTFGEAIEALRQGYCVARACWNGKGMFITKQVPSHIGEEVIPKMQSLPDSAKSLLMAREMPFINYCNQMLIVHPDNRADSWVPSVSDVFAEDWCLKLTNAEE